MIGGELCTAGARALLATAVFGCGRSHFDPLADSDGPAACATTVGHDEDGDGVDDGCDTCPHLAGPQDDRDGDGVGDACDPQPLVASERIAFFDPFLTARSEWTFFAPPTVADDVLNSGPVVDFWNMAMVDPTGSDRFVIGMRVLAVGAGPKIAFRFGSDPGAQEPNYYCELQNGYFTITHYDGGTYSAIGDSSDPTTDLGNQPLVLTFDQRTTALDCTIALPDETLTSTSLVPADVSAELLDLFLFRIAIEVEYFVVIHTD